MTATRETGATRANAAQASTVRREWVFHLLATVLCLLIIWGGTEAYVRLFVDDGMQFDLEMWKYARDIKTVSPDPLIGHQHLPNREARLMGVDVATNSRGLRDGEYAYERTPGTLRVLMLGDSFTEGWGVGFADTFSKRIERMYTAAGVKADVINTGVGNWDTIEEVQYFLDEGYKYRPDVVVLNFFVNDAEPVPQDAPPGFLMRHCYSCVFLAGRLDTLMREAADRKDWADYYLGLYDHGRGKGWLDAKAAIKRLADYCKAHNIKLLIASLPELHDVQHYRFQEITDLVKQAAYENGAAFVDLLPSVKDQDSSRLWVTKPDPHPNALANKFFADALYQQLRTME
jgi:lysophospholipase L1-like esterase